MASLDSLVAEDFQLYFIDDCPKDFPVQRLCIVASIHRYGAQRPEGTLRDQIAKKLKCHRVKVPHCVGKGLKAF
jgi:hypothetical protein